MCCKWQQPSQRLYKKFILMTGFAYSYCTTTSTSRGKNQGNTERESWFTSCVGGFMVRPCLIIYSALSQLRWCPFLTPWDPAPCPQSGTLLFSPDTSSRWYKASRPQTFRYQDVGVSGRPAASLHSEGLLGRCYSYNSGGWIKKQVNPSSSGGVSFPKASS